MKRIGPVQRHILEALEAAGGAIVPTRTLSLDLYGSTGQPENVRIRNAVASLRRNRLDLTILGYNGGRSGRGGYQIPVEDRTVDLVGMTLPAMLVVLRGRDRLTQTALAVQSGVSLSSVSLIESGKQAPSRRMIELFARAFRLDPSDRDRFLIAAGFWPWRLRPSAVEQIIGAVRRRPPQEKAS